MRVRAFARFIHVGVVLLGVGVMAVPTAGQAPPALLPPSVTGRPQPTPPASGAVPAVATTTRPVAPADRFRDAAYPPETTQALASVTAAVDWLGRMHAHQGNGRFLPGVNPAFGTAAADEGELEQATACLALARAARFTLDERTAAAAKQSVLALLTLTKPDPADADCRAPTFAADRGNKAAFAATLAMAIYDLPDADPKLTAEGERLCRFLFTRLREDGSVQCADSAEQAKADADGMRAYPGLCLQALAASERAKPERWKADALARGVKFYRAEFAASKTAEAAAALLPAACECAARAKSKEAAEFAFEMADWLCERQYTAADAGALRWVGGVKPAAGKEPTAHTAACADGLAAATALTVQTADLARYPKYRAATTAALGFARTLQFTSRSTAHFTEEYRKEVVGGVYGSSADATVRCGHAGRLVSAGVRFLESGAEKGE